MLGEIDLRHHIYTKPTGEFRTHNGKRQVKFNKPVDDGLDWVICGGETGPNARPMHPEWVHSLCKLCAGAGVPFFFKSWGEYTAIPRPDVKQFTDGSLIPDGAEPVEYQRVGKKSAGRLLDGREWNEFPE